MPAYHDPAARAFKAIVRASQIPDPRNWTYQGSSCEEVRSLICPKCFFRNEIACEEPGPKKRLNAAQCMDCGETLICPECWKPLEEKPYSDQDNALFCTNSECDVWISIW